VARLLEDVMEDLTVRLGPLDGAVRVLPGGLTNTNFRVRMGEGDYVLRLPGAGAELLGIDRQAERVASEAAAQDGVGPEVVTVSRGCLVTRFIDGRALDPEDLRDPGMVHDVAITLRRLHDSGRRLPVAFDSFRVVERLGAVALEHGVEAPPGYGAALSLAHRIEATLTGPDHDPVPCHNDLLAANFLLEGHTLRIVDWEYAGMGDRYFDLGNFAVNNGLDAQAEGDLLASYWGEPATSRQLATVWLMRFMSDFREAMWGVVQSAVSKLDFDFEGYAAQHFARLQQTAADPELEDWLGAARGA
jgi:thiamine kinase-like enzyme